MALFWISFKQGCDTNIIIFHIVDELNGKVSEKSELIMNAPQYTQKRFSRHELRNKWGVPG